MSTPLRTYYRGDELVGMRDGPGNKSCVFHFDHQGTTQCLTDRATGAVTDQFASDAWGVQVKRTGTSINRQWYVGNRGYYAQCQNAWSYIRSRYLASLRAAWSSQDRHPRGVLSYAYSSNNPVKRIDPSGFLDCDPICGPSIDKWFGLELALHIWFAAQLRALQDAEFEFFTWRLIDPLQIRAVHELQWADYFRTLNYKTVDFDACQVPPCPSFNCSSRGRTGERPGACGLQWKPRVQDPAFRNITSLTLCGHCVDSTSLGNIMFGLTCALSGTPDWVCYLVARGIRGLQCTWDKSEFDLGYGIQPLLHNPFWLLSRAESSVKTRFRRGQKPYITMAPTDIEVIGRGARRFCEVAGTRLAATGDPVYTQAGPVQPCEPCDRPMLAVSNSVPPKGTYSGGPRAENDFEFVPCRARR